MERFVLNENIKYATDIMGVAVADLNNEANFFIPYPAAAVWLVICENHGMKKSTRMLQAILGKSEKETVEFMKKCLSEWKNLKIIC